MLLKQKMNVLKMALKQRCYAFSSSICFIKFSVFCKKKLQKFEDLPKSDNNFIKCVQITKASISKFLLNKNFVFSIG